MANTNKLNISELDFDTIKTNLKNFLSSQTEFQDYNFEGSSLSILLDILSYNTHYLSYIANVTANEISTRDELTKLLIDQIESRVRWRESVIKMTDKGVNHFIEIGPGKVLSGLVKRINKNVKINTINSDSDIKDLNL